MVSAGVGGRIGACKVGETVGAEDGCLVGPLVGDEVLVGAFVGEGEADVGAGVGDLVVGAALLGERPVRKGRITDICGASALFTGSRPK